MQNYNGKAIYNPRGKAAEYAKWACNFYVGCSNGCEYCYLKKGRCAKITGGEVPTLKKCFKNESHAFAIFNKELLQNKDELQKHGLFFSFTSDPMLPESYKLTLEAILLCRLFSIPVKILTKCADWVDVALQAIQGCEASKIVAFGFTLTGHDELEKGASTNQERIDAMKKLHDAGFKTFASIEPVVDFGSSYNMILKTKDFCDLYKIGLMSGVKYNTIFIKAFINGVITCIDKPVYFKDSLLKAANWDRANLPANCVTRDYNMFQ